MYETPSFALLRQLTWVSFNKVAPIGLICSNLLSFPSKCDISCHPKDKVDFPLFCWISIRNIRRITKIQSNKMEISMKNITNSQVINSPKLKICSSPSKQELKRVKGAWLNGKNFTGSRKYIISILSYPARSFKKVFAIE